MKPRLGAEYLRFAAKVQYPPYDSTDEYIYVPDMKKGDSLRLRCSVYCTCTNHLGREEWTTTQWTAEGDIILPLI
jgi:hypothetical protein